jgi:hypothetical protein
MSDKILKILLRSSYYRSMDSLRELEDLFAEYADELSVRTVRDAISNLQDTFYSEFLGILNG